MRRPAPPDVASITSFAATRKLGACIIVLLALGFPGVATKHDEKSCPADYGAREYSHGSPGHGSETPTTLSSYTNGSVHATTTSPTTNVSGTTASRLQCVCPRHTFCEVCTLMYCGCLGFPWVLKDTLNARIPHPSMP